MRFLQFIDHFERTSDGAVQFDVAPLLEDHSLQQLYQDGSRNLGYLLKRYFKRAGLLLSSFRYDLVWIEKEIFPLLPALAERALRAFGVKTLVDYDDAAYAWYQQHPNWLVRTILGRKIDAVCRAADTVVAGNPTLAAFARAAGASEVVVVPSMINVDKYLEQGAHQAERRPKDFVVGWIGTPSNVQYLQIYKDALTGLASKHDYKFLTIGAPDKLFDGVTQEAHRWTERTEAELLSRCDCTLAPLTQGDFERGKCGFKVIQGMAAGLPVIASPVGIIRDIVQHGENGFLAETAEDCRQVLQLLHDKPDLRSQVGQAARKTIKRYYADHALRDRLSDVLHTALNFDTGMMRPSAVPLPA